MPRLFLCAICADAVNGHFVLQGFESARNGHAGQFVRQIDIINRPAGAAMKMPVLGHVRAEPGGAALHSDLPRETRFHKGVEAIVNRGVGNFRHRFFGAHEHFLGGRVVALLHEHVIDLLPLRGEAQAGGTQLFGQVLIFFTMAARLHYKNNLAR